MNLLSIAEDVSKNVSKNRTLLYPNRNEDAFYELDMEETAESRAELERKSEDQANYFQRGE